MNGFHKVFFLALAVLFFSFLAASIGFHRRGKKIFSFTLSQGSLFLSALVFSVGFLEGSLLYFEKKVFSGNGPPPAPAFLQKWGTNAHLLVPNNIFYIASPNKEFRTFGYKFSTNRLGFRERNFSFKKLDNTYRILVFGDSLTFGEAIDNDHRYTETLEGLLNLSRKNAAFKFEVLNFGMGGYSTDQEHELMKAVLRHVECDLVIIGFYENDFQPTTKGILSSFAVMDKIDLSDPKSKDLEIFNRPDRSSPLSISPQYFRGVVPWHEKTLIYKLIEDRTNINIHKLPGDFERNYLFSEFSGIMELTKRHRLPPPVVALLYAGDVPPNKNDFRNPTGHLARHIHLMRFVGENLRKNGFSVVDPLPLFQKYNKMSMAVSEWDRHPNYLSHYVYARSIYDFLTAKVLDPALIDKSNDL